MFFNRQKGHANGILAGCRQAESQGLAFAREKLMWDLNQQSGAITGFRIASAGAAVCEVDQNLDALLDDLMALLTSDAGDKADATSIVLMRRIVKTLRWGQAVVCLPVLQKCLLKKALVGWRSFVTGRKD
jgi:hypothetical protein